MFAEVQRAGAVYDAAETAAVLEIKQALLSLPRGERGALHDGVSDGVARDEG